MLDISKSRLLLFWPHLILRNRISLASCKRLQTSGKAKEAHFYLLVSVLIAWDSVPYSSEAGFILFTPRARAQHSHMQWKSCWMLSSSRISTVSTICFPHHRQWFLPACPEIKNLPSNLHNKSCLLCLLFHFLSTMTFIDLKPWSLLQAPWNAR